MQAPPVWAAFLHRKAGGFSTRRIAASAHTSHRKGGGDLKRKAWVIAALCIGALLSGVYAAVHRDGGAAVESPAPAETAAVPSPEPTPEPEEFHILLLGADEPGEDDPGRSDTMMVLSVEPASRRVVLCSLMRDIYCPIPGYGSSRLNHAYMWGGPALLRETIEANFGIRTDGYVLVDFDGFRAAIDAIGGVELELAAEEAAYLGLEAGIHRLDGAAALEYARERTVGNADYDRTARQRKLVKTLIERAETLSLGELAALARELLPQVKTDLSYAQLLSLAMGGQEYRNYELSLLRLPADGTMTERVVDGMMVLDIDFAANQRLWQETVYGE